ncbi:hypothetical protein [Aliikangiella maris]|uniref:Uncharacterized protein n=2 Tax=Aliikangiella maris TaxID=3162458 RepID=A0ABV3MKZ3_9GAMM
MNKNIQAQAILDQLIGYFNNKNNNSFKVSINYPREKFSNIPNLTFEEKIKLLEVHSPSVDDVAAFIKSKQLNDSDLILLTKYTKNIDSIIGFDEMSTHLNLLDYAVAYGHYDLFEHLISLQVFPVDDNYLNNTLELALGNLKTLLNIKEFDEELEIPDKLINIINKLISYGYGADIYNSEKNLNLLKLNLTNWTATFNKKEIDMILHNHKLDLYSISRRDKLDTSIVDSSDIDSVEGDFEQYLIENNLEYLLAAKNNCKKD